MSVVETIVFVTGLVTFAIGGFSFYFNRKRDNSETTRDFVEVKVKLDEVITNTRETKDDVRNLKTEIDKTQINQVRLEEKMNAMDKRITTLESKGL